MVVDKSGQYHRPQRFGFSDLANLLYYREG